MNMKGCLVCAIAVLAASAFADLKMATVNMVDLIRFHPQSEINRKMLSEKGKRFEERLDALKVEMEAQSKVIRSIQDEVQNPMLTQKAKEESYKKFEAAQRKFLEAQNRYRKEAMDYQQQMQEQETDFLKATGETIREKVRKYAMDKGYDIVVDSTMAVYANQDMDITDDIFRLLGVDPEKVAAVKAEAAARPSIGVSVPDLGDKK